MSEQEKALKGKHIITSDDILGKDVIDTKGNHVGVITQIHIDKIQKKILGISIDSGFMKPFIFVGTNLIENFGVDAIYISHTPSTIFVGLRVFDKIGIEVGSVIGVDFTENGNVRELHVKTGMFKKCTVKRSDIHQIGKSVILKLSQAEVHDLISAKK